MLYDYDKTVSKIMGTLLHCNSIAVVVDEELKELLLFEDLMHEFDERDIKYTYKQYQSALHVTDVAHVYIFSQSAPLDSFIGRGFDAVIFIGSITNISYDRLQVLFSKVSPEHVTYLGQPDEFIGTPLVDFFSHKRAHLVLNDDSSGRRVVISG